MGQRTHTSPHLLVAPAASGKTTALLHRLREPRRGWAYLVVPGNLQYDVLHTQRHTLPRVAVSHFHRFARVVLRRAGIATSSMNDTLRQMLVRAVLRDLSSTGRLPRFSRVAHKPGFVATVAGLLAEATAAEVSPSALAAAGVSPNDEELATVYEACNETMQRLNLADSHRHMVLARDALLHTPDLLRGITLLAVDGFDQFTPLQRSMLAAAAPQVEECIITLSWEPGERPALRRFDRTYNQIVAQLAPVVSPCEPPPVPDTPDTLDTPDNPIPPRSPVLAHLAAHVFNLDTPTPIDATGALMTIAAADREREVRAVLRRVRGLIAQGNRPERIAILVRSSGRYEPLLCEVADEYDIPLKVYAGLPLIEAVPVVALLMLLQLPLTYHPLHAVAEVWRYFADGRLCPRTSPDLDAVSLDWEQAAGLLGRIGSRAGGTVGVLNLRKRLEARALEARAQEPPDPPDSVRHPSVLSPEEAGQLHALLEAWAAWLKPPKQAPMAAYAAWLQERVVLVPDQPNPPEQPEQHTPLASVQSMLKALVKAATVLEEPAIDYATFVGEVSAALAGRRYQGGLSDAWDAGTVPVVSVLDTRGVHADHVVLMGMAEGEFPLRLSDPPLYSRRERMALAERGVPLLPPDPADERSLFYETLALARQSLTLARTYLDDKGNPIPPSSYLAAVLDLVEPESVEQWTLPAGSVPTMADAVSPQEVLVALMREPVAAATATVTPADTPPLLPHVQFASEVEQHREGRDPHGPYEGMLNDAHLAAAIANRFDTNHRWSITQLNSYTTCPFLFAATYVLRLEEQQEPEEGLDRAGRGQLYHDILAKAGTDDWAPAGRAFAPEHEEAIIDALNRAADTVLPDAPAHYRFSAGVFWEWEQLDIRQRLVRAVRRVLREGKEWTRFRPVALEWGFGMRDSTVPPLHIHTPGGTVQVMGRIDRVDESDEATLAVLDYKSSGSPRPLTETVGGYDVQLPIYVLAVEKLLRPGQQVERAAFFHLGSGKLSTALTSRHRDEAHDAMIARVTEVVAGVQSGVFAVRPRDGVCPSWCRFAGVCRVNPAKTGT